jgi:ATP-dependent exoDNAse (exonuclease V) beta subunit
MSKSNLFKIYNASAGTGKTFNVVKDYLVLLLNSDNISLYKNILAVTFTNKAVNEMKQRIIELLVNYSNLTSVDSSMMGAIMRETDLNEKEIFNKSSLILKNMLKNYASFEISTIDKLTQKIVRGFTYELGIDSKYEVEIDQKDILDRAVDKLISQIKIDDNYFEEIINFSFEKTNNDKSWDITRDLQEVSKLLLNECNYSQLELIKGLKSNDFKNAKKTLVSSVKKLEKDTINISNTALNLIDKNQLEHKVFSRKTLPNHFKKISSGNFDKLYENQLENSLVKKTLHSSKASKEEIIKINEIRGRLLSLFERCKKNIFQIKLFNNILKNLSPLSILGMIKKELEEMKNDENFIVISEFNKIINDEIKNQPAPFIYEKIGVKYNHFFIDEFQDTSKMQWGNLKPLIENSLSSENSSITIAGDPKQAIYSWRGGDVNEFIRLIKNPSPFYCEKINVELDTNYRSSKEIVKFNNGLFNHINKLYSENHELVKIFDFPSQKNFKNINGVVNIDFYDYDENLELNDFYKTKTLSNIQSARKRNYSLKDICVIVRKKKEGKEIGDFLSENNIPIISSEVLNLSSSPSVNLIINLIDYSINESNSAKMRFSKCLFELKMISKPKEDFLLDILCKNFNDIKNDIVLKNFSFSLSMLKSKPVYEAIEYIIDCFNLAKNGNSYVQFLLDFANEYSNKYQTSFLEFLDHYNEKKEKLNIISPKEINAVEIITIHKSKGLEFPVVIYPYANINIHSDLNPKAWIDFKNQIDFKITNPLININKDLENIDKELYDSYRRKLEIDNINLLYVVLTRAQNELFIISKKDQDRNGNEKINLFSGIFISYLKNIGIWDESKNKYLIGSEQEFSDEKQKVNNIFQKEFSFNSRLKRNIITNDKNVKSWLNKFDDTLEKGNIFHLIMSEIFTEKDIQLVLSKYYELGEISASDKEVIQKTVCEIIRHKDLIKFYSPKYISYNEREIIDVRGKSFIPDRIVFLDKKNIALIDYKTGTKKNRHVEQLKIYESKLESMGFKTVKKIIIYVSDKIEIKSI